MLLRVSPTTTSRYVRFMPRAHRRLIAGGIYHVTNRGNRKQPIFLSDADRRLFLDIGKRISGRHRWSVHGYCLMQNHYHLVVQTPNADLSAGMQAINGEYAQWFNRDHGFVGHVFQGRFKAILVESDWHLLELARYLAMNPVRAGLCFSPSQWPWSSFGEVVGDSALSLVQSSKVLRFFGEDPERARQAFREFVEAH
jgi:putative transposase